MPGAAVPALVHHREGLPGKPSHMFLRTQDRGCGGDELGRLGIPGMDGSYRQPAEQVGRVGAEDVLVHVGLVDDHVPEVG